MSPHVILKVHIYYLGPYQLMTSGKLLNLYNPYCSHL